MRLLFLIVQILLLTSFGKAQGSNFFINLKINGLDTGVYKLSLVEFASVTTSSIIYTDTLSKQRNTVQIKGFVPEERYVYLSVRRSGEFDFSIGPGDSVAITLTNLQFRDSFNVNGSNRVVQSAIYLNKKQIDQADELERQKTRIDSLIIAEAGKEKIDKAKDVLDSLYYAIFSYNKKYADTVGSAVAAAMALDRYTKDTGRYDILPDIERNINRFGNLVTLQSLMVAYNNKTSVPALYKVRDKISIDSVFGLTAALKIKNIMGKKRLVLIDFWASWCKPCIDEFPFLNNTYKSFKTKEFEIVSISFDKDEKLWKETRKRFPTKWKEHYIERTALDSKPAKALGIKSIPRNYLIDKNGVIYGRNLRGTQLLEILKKLL